MPLSRSPPVAEPVLANAIEQRDALEEQLLQRGTALENAGYPAQVKVTARSTVLFHISRDGRQAVTSNAGSFESGNNRWTKSQLLAAIHSEPESFSPNALLRPVVQDFLLPTVAYIGGPSEISYFAQSEVLYRNLLGRMPVMLPRAGFTVVDTKAQRLLKQYGLEVEDVWVGPQELRKRFIPIQTIGFGTPAQVDETLMRNISVETSGLSYQAITASTMFDVFGMTLVAILKGNTASMATRSVPARITLDCTILP